MATFRWGILSTASINEKLMPAMRRCEGAEIVAVASRDMKKAQRYAKVHGIPQAYGSYEDLVASGEVDAVYNPLPNVLHLPWTLRCIQAGIPVLCEKPLTLSAKDAQTLATAAANSGVFVAEAFMYRFHPVFARLKELVNSGVIGRVHTIHSDFAFLLDDPTGIPARGELGGGALLDVGCYCVNFSRLITGAEPIDVAAMARFALSGPGTASWDDPMHTPTPGPAEMPGAATFDKTMTGLMRFPHGVLASFTTSIGATEQHRVEVRGEDGVLTVEHPWHPRPSEIIRLERYGQDPQLFPVEGDDPYYLQVRHFQDVCTGKRPQPMWPIQESVLQARAMDALARSARTHRFEQV